MDTGGYNTDNWLNEVDSRKQEAGIVIWICNAGDGEGMEFGRARGLDFL